MRDPREQIRRRLVKVIRQTEQLARDANAWNDLHPEEQPMDSETDRIVAYKARQALAAMDSQDMGRCCRLCEELGLYTENSEYGAA